MVQSSVSVPPTGPKALTLVVNWFEELNARAAAK
jgi:hypothetical protein